MNGAVFGWINDLAGHSPIADDGMKLAAKYGVYLMIAVVAASWFVGAGPTQTRRLAAYASVAAAALGIAVAVLIQHYYVHQRPFVLRNDVVQLVQHSADASFPSEHATAAFGLATGAGLFRLRLGLLLVAIACVTAFARVYVGIHYPADVGAGAGIGAIAGVLVWVSRPAIAWLDDILLVRFAPGWLR